MQWISQDRSTQKNDLTSMIEIWNEVVEDGVISNIHARHICERLGFVQPGVGPFLRIPAKTEPEILCQTLKIAPGSVASGLVAKFAVARETASPLFCLPTSIAIAVALEYSI